MRPKQVAVVMPEQAWDVLAEKHITYSDVEVYDVESGRALCQANNDKGGPKKLYVVRDVHESSPCEKCGGTGRVTT